MVNCKKIQHNYSKYSKTKPYTKRKPNISTVKYSESRVTLGDFGDGVKKHQKSEMDLKKRVDPVQKVTKKEGA